MQQIYSLWDISKIPPDAHLLELQIQLDKENSRSQTVNKKKIASHSTCTWVRAPTHKQALVWSIPDYETGMPWIYQTDLCGGSVWLSSILSNRCKKPKGIQSIPP